jgi:ADP-heptose:LPS heptosyltransferase
MSFSDSQRRIQRVLIFRIGELGDTLVSLPSLRAIRDHFSSARIVLLSNADTTGGNVNVREVVPEGLVDDWLQYPSAGVSRQLRNSLELLIKIRRYSFDVLIYLAPRLRNARDVRRDLVFFRLAGIKKVIGADGFQPLPKFQNQSLPRVTNEVDHLLERISLSGISVPKAGGVKVDLQLSNAEHRKAINWLQSKFREFEARQLVGFGPGSKWPSKVWPEERFQEVGRLLINEFDIDPIVFGGPKDRAQGDRLIRSWARGANAAGELSVREAAATLSHCRMYVGNDTGTMHLAAAVSVPCVVAMSALDWPGHWYPYGEGHMVLRKSVPCEGCLLKVCDRDMKCLNDISTLEVAEACRKTLANVPAFA